MKEQVLELLQDIHEAKDLISLNDLLGLTTAEELKDLSDTLDELVKDRSIPNSIIKEINRKKVDSLYRDSQNVKSIIRIYLVIGTGILIFFALIVIYGIFFVK